MKKNRDNFENYLYAILVFTAIFLPINNYPLLNIIALTFVSSYIFIKSKSQILLNKSIYPLFGFITLIFIQVIIQPSNLINISNAVEEIIRVIIYIVIILLLTNLNINKKEFLKIWICLFIIVSLIGIFQYLKIFNINYILSIIYGLTIHLEVSTKYDSLSLFRAGSVYLNPNTFAKYILIFLALYLTQILPKTSYNLTVKFILGFLIIVSLVLTGSRTGLIISVIIFLLFVFNYLIKFLKGKIKVSIKSILWYNFVLFIVFIFITLLIITLDFSSIRFLSLSGNYDGSLSYKIKTIFSMLNNFDIYNIFLGMGPFEGDIRYVTLLDSDIGYLISYYGFIGIVLYAIFLYQLIIKNTFNNKIYVVMILTIILLFSITGGIFFNLRFFIIFLLLFSVNLRRDDK